MGGLGDLFPWRVMDLEAAKPRLMPQMQNPALRIAGLRLQFPLMMCCSDHCPQSVCQYVSKDCAGKIADAALFSCWYRAATCILCLGGMLSFVALVGGELVSMRRPFIASMRAPFIASLFDHVEYHPPNLVGVDLFRKLSCYLARLFRELSCYLPRRCYLF